MQPCQQGKGSCVCRGRQQYVVSEERSHIIFFARLSWSSEGSLSADVSNAVYWVTEASRGLSMCQKKQDGLVLLHGLEKWKIYIAIRHKSDPPIFPKDVYRDFALTCSISLLLKYPPGALTIRCTFAPADILIKHYCSVGGLATK